MGQMPLRGAHIRHRLNDVIFRLQRLAHPLGKLTNLLVTLRKILRAYSFVENGKRVRIVGVGSYSHITFLPFAASARCGFSLVINAFKLPGWLPKPLLLRTEPMKLTFQPPTSRRTISNSPNESIIESGAQCKSASRVPKP